ncbi:MAG: hypothetical protein D5R97_07775 [Candidatus Syntrophonatronum acetioxidans]|uniref:Uncharacterized protein n=1 Tax=Candidatus Syntrophonatronum acetioxidans TaxID=1795816 RepID=A0A424YBM0_9FIRM|nr:MAG: hypothetical protein D5R97_07775 [Candidatus Syntrophonatronum acetioxidans]
MYFLSLVIIPKCPVGEVENSVRKTLERNYFDSNGQHSLDKPVYTKALVTCDCQDKRGDDYARKEAEEKVGSFSWLKECFFQECPGSSPMEFFRDPRFLKWWKTYREALEEFFSRGMEGVSCSRCQNKDRLYMEVDLRSSLEWFTVGHRWHGVLKGKNQFYYPFAPPLVISYRHLWEGTLETLVLGTTAIKRDNYKEFILSSA